MADKKYTQPQDGQDAESVEDGFEKLLEDAARRDRLYRELRDVPKLFRPAPLLEEPEEVELPPSPERPLAGTSLKQLLNHGKKYGDDQPQDDHDAEHVGDGSDDLFEDAARRYRVYREHRDVSKLVRPAPSPEREPPSFERPLAGTSLKQLLNHGKAYSEERGDARP